MLKLLLNIVLFAILIEHIIAEFNETVSNSTEPLRPFNFVVARKGDKPLVTANKIDDPDAWFLQRRKRLLAIQRKLFAARRNHFNSSTNYRFGTNTSYPNYKSKRLDYLRKPSSAFLLANKVVDKPLKYKTLSNENQVYFVSLPIVLPPVTTDPFEFHGPPQTCVKGKSGFLCCNKTLEDVILSTYEEMRNQPTFSPYNLHKIAQSVQRSTEKRFGVRFEVIATASDFVSKSNFNADLNCKVRVDGKVILAYSTPIWRPADDFELIDATGLLSSDGPVSLERTTIAAEKLAQIRQRLIESTLISSTNGETLSVGEEQKPIFLVYGPIR